jgi:amidase
VSLNRTTHECLATIAEREDEIHAWVEVAPRGEFGIPFGVKDIFETANMATEYGSPLYKGRKGTHDAALVTLLEQHGGVLLGKTQTTAFAFWDAAPTRNPLNLAHTPGGSSSGSVAAVASGMCAFATGTQTQGSVIRPAAFCGICGFKPSYGALPMEGCLPFAPALDTAGLFTVTAGDMRELWRRLGFAADAAAPRRYAAFEIDRELAGLPVDRIETPLAWRRAAEICFLISDYEGARSHEARYRQHGEAIGAKLADLVRRGLAVTRTQYEEALAELRALGVDFEKMFAEYPALLTASAPGPAPPGLQFTGDPIQNRAWTALGVPAITVRRPGVGLPLGLQIATARGSEAVALAAACAWEQAFAEAEFAQ